MKKVIQKRWEKFEEQVLKDAPPLQKAVMRLAFVAGMFEMHAAAEILPAKDLKDLAIAVKKESEEYTKESSITVYNKAKKERQ